MSASAHPTTRASVTDAGFTLLELLVVVIVMGVVATIAIPHIPGLERERLHSAAATLGTDLRLLRAQAIRYQQMTSMLIEDRAYILLPQGRRRTLQTDIILRVATSLPSLLATTAKRIEFFPDGSSTGGIIVLDQGSRSIKVAVRWTDGMVEAHE